MVITSMQMNQGERQECKAHYVFRACLDIISCLFWGMFQLLQCLRCGGIEVVQQLTQPITEPCHFKIDGEKTLVTFPIPSSGRWSISANLKATVWLSRTSERKALNLVHWTQAFFPLPHANNSPLSSRHFDRSFRTSVRRFESTYRSWLRKVLHL